MIRTPAPLALDATDEIAALVGTLTQCEKRLEVLTGGEVDTVADAQGRTFLLRSAQDRLRRDNAARQDAILNSLPAHIAMLDARGRIVTVNESWRRFGRLHGFAGPRHGVGLNYLSVCDTAVGAGASEAREAAAGIRDVISGRRKEFAFEYACHNAQRECWFLLTATPLIVGHQDGGVVVSHFDMTDQKASERALRDSEARFRATFEQAAVGMTHVGLDGRYLRVNDQFCTILGYSRAELVGMNVAQVTVPEHHLDTLTARAAMLRRETLTYSAEKLYMAKGGATIWVRVVSTLLRDADDAPLYFISVVEDVTARKLAERRLERINRLYAVLSKVGEVISRTRDPQRLREEVCRIIVADGLLLMCAVVAADEVTGRYDAVAQSGSMGDYLASVSDLTAPGLPREGTIGVAIRTGNHDVCNDIGTDPRIAPWRVHALRHGYQSVASFPLKSGNVTTGALALFAAETQYFQDDEIRLMDAVAEDVSLAVESLASERQRRQAEEGLRRTQTMLASAVRIAELGSWEYDVVNDRCEWSDETLKIFGVRREDFGGDEAAFLAQVHVDDRDRARLRPADALPHRSAREIEYRIIRPDGALRIVQDRGTIVDDDAGRPLRATGMLMDITARRDAEIALRRSDERFKRVFNQQFQITVILSPDGAVLEVNDLPLRLGGMTRADVLGRHFWDTAWLHGLPEAAGWWRDVLATAARQDDPVLREGQFRRADGRVLDLDLAITAVKRDDGTAEYFILQGADVTDRKLAEAQSRARIALLKSAGHTARLGGWCLDVVDRRVTWSDEIFAIFEIPQGPMPSLERALDCYAPEYRRTVSDAVAAAIANGTPFDLEVEGLTPSGRRLWVRAVGDVERAADGAVVRVQGALQDISDRRYAEAEKAARWKAEQANQAKSTFLATMSHEIRTPMNGVLGMIEILCQTSLDRNQMEMVDLVRESAFSLLGIIDGILDFSKIEAGKLEIEHAPMSVADLVESVCEMAYPMAAKRGVEILPFIDPAIPAAVLGDAARLRQVLVNLVNNAVKFSGDAAHGRVFVRALAARDDDGHGVIEFRVADNGIGMNAETLARLFTSFTQADASTTRRFGGTGLGLAISARLVELMKGTITVASQPREGSTFSVRLGLVPADPPREALVPDPDTAGLRCVVVCAHPVNDPAGASIADDAALYLRNAGAIVTRATSIAGAPQLAGGPDPSVWVVVAMGESDVTALPAAVPGRLVVIGRGSRRHPQPDADGVVHLDRNALHRRTLLAAVAVAAGRASSDGDAVGRPTAPPASAAHPRGADERLHPRLVLVAEDNETNQKVILRQLNLLGYVAHIAGSGPEALELWRHGDYALLLTDLQMPDLDGYDLAKLIRAEECGIAHIPIIALTANALRDEVERCKAVGMDDYLTKPVPLARLQACMERWWQARDPAPAPDAAPGRTAPAQDLGPAAPGGDAPPRPRDVLAQGLDPNAVAPDHVDIRLLAALVGDDEEVLLDFLEEFRKSLEQAACELQAARASAAPDAVEAIAHRFKSAARSVGALQLGRHCEAIEGAAGRRDLTALAGLYPSFEAEMSAVSVAIEALCKRH